MNQYLSYKKKTGEGISSAKELVYKAAVLITFVTALVWLSVFQYIVFYNIYMPNVTHIRPVHFQFKPCEDTMGICSFPYAYVQLTKSTHLLMPGQTYRIRLMLEVPESIVNQDLGMFMVCTQMRAKGGVLVSSSCRSVMLRYKSPVHQLLYGIMMSPLLITKVLEEKQDLHVELFQDFVDDPNQPVTDAYVELQSRFAQVYGAELLVEAHFTGLRFFMYNFPKISAVFGIGTNLFFVTLVFILSWYNLQDGLPELLKNKFGYGAKESDDEKSTIGKVKLEKEDTTPMYEGDVLLEEFMQIEGKKEKAT
ncbi:hypothetical protein O3G_MSEX010764 [Manduca sexta]|uniref:Seipin n=1 Tax=Manduca sexta TaxID=7130 RepID=A0A921ZIL4_MANSE|nr:hypothetical protein O3G_MSEX010764 [Manduca sexta]